MDILPLCGPREFRLHVESHAASGMQQTAWPQNCTDMWISLHHSKYICTRSSCLADKLKRATWCCLNAELNCMFTPLRCSANVQHMVWNVLEFIRIRSAVLIQLEKKPRRIPSSLEGFKILCQDCVWTLHRTPCIWLYVSIACKILHSGYIVVATICKLNYEL